MKHKCLILLATYNGENYIKEQLDSILGQVAVDVKIIVSDDMSSDKTLSIIKAYEDERIELLPSAGRMGSASQNFFRLIKDSDFDSFEYIAFADQDDIWYSDKLFEAIKVMNERNLSAYSSNVLAFWENGKEVVIKKARHEKEFDYLFGSAGPGCTYVLKKDLFMDFKNSLIKKEDLSKNIDLHDWLMYAYARSKNYKWYIDDKVTMKYRQHDNNEFGANNGFKAIANRWARARKGWYRKQILQTVEFCDIDNNLVKRLIRNNYFDRLVLAFNVFKFRRNPKEAIFLFFILILPGFK